ncbi:MAG: GNAT family N-acetyltransferase [Armatimonadota bacterium]
MQIRSLRLTDIEPLHALYKDLTLLMPHQLMVRVEQFAQELTTTRYQEDEFWDRAADLPLVAERAGQPVAFLHASFLEDNARYRSLKAGTGIIRFLFSAPQDADALRALVKAAVDSARARHCPDLQALSGYGPLFHNCGASGLSNAWPWVGRVLVQEGFESLGSPALAMYRPLDQAPLLRLPLPPGAELRFDWVTRIGQRDETEGGYHILFGEDRAAESMWHFGEKYVCGSANSHAHLFWLGTNEPYRGRGLGRILLRETLAQVQEMGARGSDLRCNINNFYAHALYRAEGYKPNDLLWSFKKPMMNRNG